MKKKLIGKRLLGLGVTMACIVGTMIVPTYAADNIRVTYNNKAIQFTESMGSPFVSNSRVLVPLRAVSEGMNKKVDWNATTKKVTVSDNKTVIQLTIGNKNVSVNGINKTTDVPATVKSGRTYVPLRFVSECIGANVNWDGSNKLVTITGNNNASSPSTTVTIETTASDTNVKDGYFQYNGKSYQIIEVDGGDRSGSRQSNVAVDIGFGDRVYWGLTNEYGQLVYVLADEIILQDDKTEPVNSNGRYYDDEANVPGTERADLDQGHVIADSLGGVSNAYNITPQNSTLNRHGNQAYMEKVIRDAGGCTNFVATITYPNTTTQIPSSYKYEYVVKGNSVVDEFPNVNPEATVDNKSEETSKPVVESNQSNDVTFDEKAELAKIDTNGNGKVTIKEAKAAGYSMPIYSDHWLYKYMDDRDGDGVVGE